MWGPESKILYCSGTTPIQVGGFAHRLELNSSKIIEGDVSNWDGSINNYLLSIEKYFLLRKVRGMPDEISMLIKHWDQCMGRSKKGGVLAELDYGRRSGDLWTSSFNSLLNVLLTMYVYRLQWSSDFMMLVLGDDNLIGLNKDIEVEYVQSVYQRLGMKMEVIERARLSESTFCSGRFWKVNNTHVWGNLPFRTLAKFGINHNNHPEKLFPRLLYGGAKGLLASGGHVPILQAYLRAIVMSAEERKIKPFVDTSHENPHRFVGGEVLEPDDETYEQFAELYDMSVESVKLAEKCILMSVSAFQGPYSLDDYIFVKGFAMDTGMDLEECEAGNQTLELEFNDHNITVDTPEKEEMHKLFGCPTLTEALSKAYEFGREEDEMGATGHRYLHQLFTLLSFYNIELGINVHRMYNRLALSSGVRPANKKQVKKIAPKLVREVRAAKSDLKSVVKNMGKLGLSTAGGMLGGSVGGPLGSAVGKSAGSWLSRIVGFGDYTINSNTLLKSNVPDFPKTGHGIRIRHRECLGDISGTTLYTTTDYRINPGDPTTFPWLSNIASNYQEYCFHGLVFTYNATSAAALNSTNTALGTVIMATRYNAALPAFINKIDMEANEFCTSRPPNASFVHAIECAENERPTKCLYIRQTNDTTVDPRWFDLGVTTLATVGMQAAATIGELWVSYDIELSKTRLPHPGPVPGAFYAISNGAYDANNRLGITQRTPIGTLGLSVITDGTGFNRVQFPEAYQSGRFLFNFTWIGSAGAVIALPTFTPSAGLSTPGDDSEFWDLNVNYLSYAPQVGANVTRFSYTRIYVITAYRDGGVYLDVTAGTLPATPVSVDLLVMAMQPTNTVW
jgi:hypothetical protein